MCGFIGILSSRETVEEEFNKRLSLIKHRGPDEQCTASLGPARFGFQRLSIVDLQDGSQPMYDSEKKLLLVFNGEIYNDRQLRSQLKEEGVRFQTASDTEVILHLYKKYKERCLDYLRGMFAFCIWDDTEKQLFAARDPFGIKPFYYRDEDEVFSFASEIKCLQTAAQISPSSEALQHYFTFQYVPEPHSLTPHVKRLQPGHLLWKKEGKPAVTRPYFRIIFAPEKGDRNNKIKKIQEALENSVSMHLRGDVPVGAFLSGGIDSTVIVALAKRLHPDIITFSAGFSSGDYQEIPAAQKAAEALGVKNEAVYISPHDFIRELPRIVWHMDDPLADPAAIPLYFVAQLASRKVKAVLSGEGADELFGGYLIYREPIDLRWFQYLSPQMKSFLIQMAKRLPERLKGKNYLIRGCTPLVDRYAGNAKIFTGAEKERLLKQNDKQLPYQKVTKPIFEKVQNMDETTKMQYLDIHTWLTGDILVKADRMTMAHGLELRVPFLDLEVFDVASRLMSDEKICGKMTKYLLREAVKDWIPESIWQRKKLGFPVPLKQWLREELYDWARERLVESRGILEIDTDFSLNLLEAHARGKGDFSRKIWTILIFVLWHQVYVEKRFSFCTLN